MRVFGKGRRGQCYVSWKGVALLAKHVSWHIFESNSYQDKRLSKFVQVSVVQ